MLGRTSGFKDVIVMKKLPGFVIVKTRIVDIISFMTTNPLILLHVGFYGVVVSTLDFESSDMGLNPSRTCFSITSKVLNCLIYFCRNSV